MWGPRSAGTPSGRGPAAWTGRICSCGRPAAVAGEGPPEVWLPYTLLPNLLCPQGQQRPGSLTQEEGQKGPSSVPEQEQESLWEAVGEAGTMSKESLCAWAARGRGHHWQGAVTGKGKDMGKGATTG